MLSHTLTSTYKMIIHCDDINFYAWIRADWQCPAILHCDNGGEFVNHLVKSLQVLCLARLFLVGLEGPSPSSIRCDDGSEFVNDEVLHLLAPRIEMFVGWGSWCSQPKQIIWEDLQYVNGMPRRPWVQGSVERVNAELVKGIFAWLADHESLGWKKGLKKLQV